jgi:hypothetical protein
VAVDIGEILYVIRNPCWRPSVHVVIADGWKLHSLKGAPRFGLVLKHHPICGISSRKWGVSGEQNGLGVLPGNLLREPKSNPGICAGCDRGIGKAGIAVGHKVKRLAGGKLRENQGRTMISRVGWILGGRAA